MTNPVGPIVEADEQLVHQVAETFAMVGTTDLAWTEKVCAMAMARDGSLQIGFGLGKYTNRDVFDAYAALSRGKEQLTVRGSRRLSTDPLCASVGPIHYEIVEPLRVVRFRLDANDCQPFSFDWTFEAVVPPFTEDRTYHLTGVRNSAELVRYHQTGVASGWIELDGERHPIDPDSSVSTRDHSWGVRYDVGVPVADVAPQGVFEPGSRIMMIWSPLLLERPDGSRYALHLHFVDRSGPGHQEKMVTARVEHPDGSEERIVDIEPHLRFEPTNRRLLGGDLVCTMADGGTRTVTLETIGDTGVHLGAGLYFGFDGHRHGEWRGELHVDGERIDDCTAPDQARRLHQIRDTTVRVDDPAGGGSGWGNCQPIVAGPFPELGLDDDFWV
jgi:hypothetical protein